jgi:hypothetical protein
MKYQTCDEPILVCIFFIMVLIESTNMLKRMGDRGSPPSHSSMSVEIGTKFSFIFYVDFPTCNETKNYSL